MHTGRHHDDGPPRNAWAAARSGRPTASSATVDLHNARFVARYIVSMMVLFVSVLGFCFVILLILGAMRERTQAVLPDIPLDYRFSR